MHMLHRWWTQPSDFAWTTAYHRTNPILQRAHIAVGIWCLLYSALCVLAAHTPAGIGEPSEYAAGYMLAGIAGIVGAAWIRGPWPSETVSKMFVVYLEASSAGALLMLSDPMVALPCAAALGVNGSYIAAFHSPKLFFGHQSWAIVISGILFTRAVTAPDADVVLASAYLVMLTLVLFSAPILTQSLLVLLRRDAATAFFDPLTGLRNRRGLAAALTETLPAGGSAAVVVIDIDNFKKVNDRYGHAQGDAVLRRTASAISGTFAAPAITARTGGEEFAVLTFVEPAAAFAFADTLRIALADGVGSDPAVTVSIGIAHTTANTLPASYDQVCRWADTAMYAAKRAGGNTIVTNTNPEGAFPC
ncbi:GGDEF domain-containing protein [Rhodococcus sp. P1Y]|uniref:GGDEF domain-containing protein n=1 Tax=Rhodococcus sp. P1Y TaxID=1302308 RepID=UPI000EAD32AD|nr:GGDEF domain-containing protein [Rhodococcus sp. P1Y]AYJ48876.1 GGDEF domain-containing protein [Rhodococcus sp. P1Y]